MKKTLLLIASLAIIGCKGNDEQQAAEGVQEDTPLVDEAVAMLEPSKAICINTGRSQ